MAKKEYTYGDQATVVVAAPGYKSQTKTYTMTGNITDSVALEKVTDIILTIRVLNKGISRPSISVSGFDINPRFILNGNYYECNITLQPGQDISYTITAIGYVNYSGIHIAGNSDDLVEVMLDVLPILPMGYTITWKSRNSRVLNFTISAYKNGQVFALSAQSNSLGVATLDGFDRGDTVSWTARSASPAATDLGTLIVGGAVVINIF